MYSEIIVRQCMFLSPDTLIEMDARVTEIEPISIAQITHTLGIQSFIFHNKLIHVRKIKA